jgi:hypothetical protein
MFGYGIFSEENYRYLIRLISHGLILLQDIKYNHSLNYHLNKSRCLSKDMANAFTEKVDFA